MKKTVLMGAMVCGFTVITSGCSESYRQAEKPVPLPKEQAVRTEPALEAVDSGVQAGGVSVAELEESVAATPMDAMGGAKGQLSKSDGRTSVAEVKQMPQRMMSKAKKSKQEFYSSMPTNGAALSMPAGPAVSYLYDADDISVVQPPHTVNRENYEHLEINPIKLTREEPVSTFSIDVDTGSYSNVRRVLNAGSLPVRDAVRVEEMINYFSYQYPLPESKDQPFSVTTEISRSPWNKDRHLLHVGLQGYDLSQEQMPPSNLVFLVDVSGSMSSPNKLGLLKQSMKLLSKNLSAKDRVAIAVYAGASGMALESVPGNEYQKIAGALDRLQAGGSTNGAAGIHLAYQVAQQNFIEGGNNRVIIATDGDFNVGTVNFEALKNLVEEKRKSGVNLTTLGFGTGNYNDHLMEQLADVGNGNYAYIDTINEARKVLVDQLTGTLNTIAKDVKIQIEFNPEAVSEYRLIGYENRMLKREDFNNDKVDAGDIGAGHTVTAIYELTLADSKNKSIDPLRYGKQKQDKKVETEELAFIKLRYKQPQGKVSKLISQPLMKSQIVSDISNTSDNFRFSAAVAGYGQLLKGGEFLGEWTYEDLLKMANSAKGKDSFGYRGEFISLVRTAQAISG